MTVEHPGEDEVRQLARRVEKARGRLAYQFDPALTEALSEGELHAERELAEKIREQEREQRWKNVQAAASTSDRARQTSEAIAKADMRDLLMARKAIAAQRRESSPHAKLASLYRHRAWSMRALAGVVIAGMLWSAVNVQHNIAPGGASDPLYWFSYLLEAMISVCLVIIMIGTNKVSEWGILHSRRQVAVAELALLALTVGLNTYPYLRSGDWYNVGVHAVAPVMIGVALLVHDAASQRYGQAITQATDTVRDLPDPAEQIRRSMPTFVSFIRQSAPDTRPTPMAALPGASDATSTESDHRETARTVETVDPVVEPDIWTPKKSSVRSDTAAADSVADGKPGKSSKSDAADVDSDPLSAYDTGQFRIADSLEQELADIRAERKRARAAKQRAANGSIVD
ncbi:FUSC family protein [Nocardia spumae]|uniref:FUSC family protein n=1 Tax=Nocardia spumae TaxID=2887190 RepID=UPI001D154474|nr:FUSC family protein [Nocardia spumae]